jgi:hypothetical protein
MVKSKVKVSDQHTYCEEAKDYRDSQEGGIDSD